MYCLHALTKSLATTDERVVEPGTALQSEMRGAHTFPALRHSTYTFWSIKFHSVIHGGHWREEEISKYNFYCTVFLKLHEWNERAKAKSHGIVLPLHFTFGVWNGSNIVGTKQFTKQCRHMSFNDTCDISDDVIASHTRIGRCDKLSLSPWIISLWRNVFNQNQRWGLGRREFATYFIYTG